VSWVIRESPNADADVGLGAMAASSVSKKPTNPIQLCPKTAQNRLLVDRRWDFAGEIEFPFTAEFLPSKLLAVVSDGAELTHEAVERFGESDMGP